MTPEERTRTMRRWDATLHDLADLVEERRDLEATPIPLGRKDRRAREDELLAVCMAIDRAQNLRDSIEEEFPECKYW